jgi:L-lysine 2,3-aminomutase
MNTGYNNEKYKVYTQKNFRTIPQIDLIDREYLDNMSAVAEVFPFRVNNHVINELIDWEKVPHDPIFQLTFPHPDMLLPEDLTRIKRLQRTTEHPLALKQEVRRIQKTLNPHPAAQVEKNVPVEDGLEVKGLQHKYNETVLFFPTQGQTCHAYCTYCFRWVQFVGMEDLKFASSTPRHLTDYLSRHPEVNDVLFTGGDPLFMRTRTLERYVEPLLTLDDNNVTSIRMGTKSVAYWPHRFLGDKDAEDLLRLFEKIVQSGIHLSIMAHFTHPRELENPLVEAAVRRILGTGAQMRCQAPLVRHINDDPQVWRELWKKEVQLGMIPYYMFIARNTGPRAYFEVPLARAHDIFTRAYANVSGLCRTVRGPSMSAAPGKVVIDGTPELNGEKVFALKFIQARDSQWVNRPFYARFDDTAVWLDDLKPAFGQEHFFFQEG